LSLRAPGLRPTIAARQRLDLAFWVFAPPILWLRPMKRPSLCEAGGCEYTLTCLVPSKASYSTSPSTFEEPCPTLPCTFEGILPSPTLFPSTSPDMSTSKHKGRCCLIITILGLAVACLDLVITPIS
jgi:hypothetical protein